MAADKQYDPKTDTYMGAIMVNLGYITPQQQQKCEFLDKLAHRLAKSDADFHKPLYGHIANGESTQAILDELHKQLKARTFNMSPEIAVGLKAFDGITLGIKGETAGSDIERKGGPLDSTLQVQRQLRDLERMGMLPETREGMRDATREAADRLHIEYPARQQQSSRTEQHFDVESMLKQSTEAAPTRAPEPVEFRRN
jgi:hypothetical protein